MVEEQIKKLEEKLLEEMELFIEEGVSNVGKDYCKLSEKSWSSFIKKATPLTKKLAEIRGGSEVKENMRIFELLSEAYEIFKKKHQTNLEEV